LTHYLPNSLCDSFHFVVGPHLSDFLRLCDSFHFVVGPHLSDFLRSPQGTASQVARSNFDRTRPSGGCTNHRPQQNGLRTVQPTNSRAAKPVALRVASATCIAKPQRVAHRR
jgi:hypothetical protein